MKNGVTVLLSSYNHNQFIVDCIHSILGQTYSNWELWVLDDASNDGTKNTLEEFAKNDSRIKLHIAEENQGKAAQLNKVIDQVTSSYIAFLDSDDYWDLNKLTKQVNILENNKDVSLVFSDGWIVESRETNIHYKERDFMIYIETQLIGVVICIQI